jgi:hypothetical protein
VEINSAAIFIAVKMIKNQDKKCKPEGDTHAGIRKTS